MAYEPLTSILTDKLFTSLQCFLIPFFTNRLSYSKNRRKDLKPSSMHKRRVVSRYLYFHQCFYSILIFCPLHVSGVLFAKCFQVYVSCVLFMWIESEQNAS